MSLSAEDIVATTADAASLPGPPLLVLEPLAAMMDRYGLGEGPLQVAPIGDGHSNITCLVRRRGAEVVLRRPPRPPLPPSSHDVLREARVLRALEQTPARVPRVLAVVDDETLIGAPFYLMERVGGDVIGERVPERLAGCAERIVDELVDALVELHEVRWRTTDLADLARPGAYVERQLRRFRALWKRNRTRHLPAIERVARWLEENAPPSPVTTVVHGDYRLGNVVFAPGNSPRLAAILDWELAALGDPLADVGYLLSNWPEQGEPLDVLNGLSRVVCENAFPDRQALIARYEQRAGRSVHNVRFYEALAIWKAAVFLEGSYARYLDGRSDDPFFAELREGVPALAERAWRAASAPSA